MKCLFRWLVDCETGKNLQPIDTNRCQLSYRLLLEIDWSSIISINRLILIDIDFHRLDTSGTGEGPWTDTEPSLILA